MQADVSILYSLRALQIWLNWDFTLKEKHESTKSTLTLISVLENRLSVSSRELLRGV